MEDVRSPDRNGSQEFENASRLRWKLSHSSANYNYGFKLEEIMSYNGSAVLEPSRNVITCL